MTEGKIVTVHKGFFFIDSPICSGVFAHRTALDKAVPLDESLVGQSVSFELEMSSRGPRTSKVWLAAEPEEARK